MRRVSALILLFSHLLLSGGFVVGAVYLHHDKAYAVEGIFILAAVISLAFGVDGYREVISDDESGIP